MITDTDGAQNLVAFANSEELRRLAKRTRYSFAQLADTYGESAETKEDTRQSANLAHMNCLRVSDYNLLVIPKEIQMSMFTAGSAPFANTRITRKGNKEVTIGLLSSLYDSVFITVSIDAKTGARTSITVNTGVPSLNSNVRNNLKPSSLRLDQSLEKQEPYGLHMPLWWYSASFVSYSSLSSSERKAIKVYWHFYSNEAYQLFRYLRQLLEYHAPRRS